MGSEKIMKKKDTIVIVSGWGIGNLVWREMISELEKQYSVYILNPNLNPKGIRLEALIEDFYNKNNIGKASIIGWSMGAVMALDFLMRNPEKIEKCILISGTSRFTSEINDDYRHGWPKKVVDKMIDKLSVDKKSVLTAFYRSFFNGEISASEKKTLDELMNSDEMDSLEVSELQAGLEFLNYKDLRRGIHEIKKEVLLIHGDRDNISPIENVCEMEEKSEMVRLKVIEGGGHLPFISDHEHIFSEIENYLEGYDDR